MTKSITSIDILRDGWNLLPASDHVFAESLVKQSFKKKLSDKQMKWVNIFAERIMKGFGASVPEPERLELDVGEFSKVIALFDAAKVQWPVVRLQLGKLPGERPVHLSRVTKGKHIGTVNVTDGGPYQNNKWYGRVQKDGTWAPGPDVAETDMEAMGLLIAGLAADPYNTVKAYGKLTGRCSVCALPLTDPKSIEAGVGPVCAKNWGFPYGD